MTSTAIVHVLKERVDVGLLGTFSTIGWESEINAFLGAHPQGGYWLPWGNRTQNLKLLLQTLLKQGLWQKKDRNQHTQIYEPQQPHPDYALKFFHYRSKAQTGNQSGGAMITTRYLIDRIVLAARAISPKPQLAQDLLTPQSTCWFRVSGYNLMRSASGKGLDFSDFNVIDLSRGRIKMFCAQKDSRLLYEDLAIVQHFSHKNKITCTCPQCR